MRIAAVRTACRMERTPAEERCMCSGRTTVLGEQPNHGGDDWDENPLIVIGYSPSRPNFYNNY